MGYEFSETNFNDPKPLNLFVYALRSHQQKNHKKQTFRDQVTGQNFSTVINKKSRFNGNFNSDFDDFIQLHSLTLYEYNE